MQKLIIFDLDGVLVESKNLHYTVLNNALKQINGKYVIGYQEHLGLYDGLSTTQKLKLLTEKKNLPTELYNKIWDLKQGATFEAIKNYPPDKYLIKLFSDLSKLDFKIAIASNSIRKTTKLFLCALGIMPYIDYYVSNEDVRYPKPYPEMYWKCMTALKCLPKDTVIIEDSHIGREGALQSGAILYPVKDTNCIRNNKFQEDVKLFFTTENKIPWRDKKMNVLIPMAGLGSRFAKAATRDIQAVSGDVSYTGIGFKPGMIIAIATLPQAVGGYCIGLLTPGVYGCQYMQSAGGIYYSTTVVISIEQTTGSKFQQAAVKSLDADGFTLEWTKTGTTDPGTIYLTFACFR